jgi:hypothetical protein
VQVGTVLQGVTLLLSVHAPMCIVKIEMRMSMLVSLWLHGLLALTLRNGVKALTGSRRFEHF